MAKKKEKIKCVCTADCYMRHESERHVHYYRGMVAGFYEVPLNFEPVDEVLDQGIPTKRDSGVPLGPTAPESMFDFGTAPEELLLAADYDPEKLAIFAATTYGVEIPTDTQKAVMVAKFVDARYRHSVTSTTLNQAVTDIATGKK
jgi:hypothetical protein